MKTRTILLLAFALPLLSFVKPSVAKARSFAIHVAIDDENDGSSYAKAIIIRETSETTGVAAEYKWLREHYPGYKMRSQSLSQHDGKPYDILKIKWKHKKMSVYFDISDFFGKF
jgi:hypothetical protein